MDTNSCLCTLFIIVKGSLIRLIDYCSPHKGNEMRYPAHLMEDHEYLMGNSLAFP